MCIIVIKIKTKRLRERKALAVECTKNKLNFFLKLFIKFSFKSFGLFTTSENALYVDVNFILGFRSNSIQHLKHLSFQL